MSSIKNGVWMGDFMKNEVKLFPIQEREAFDIDHPWQFDLCEKLWESK
jgi:CMP-N-acetylneuraminic acid synthetase